MLRIAEFRKKAGLSQRQLQNALGMRSTATVSQWESGARTPNILTLYRIAQELHCTVDDLVVIEEEHDDQHQS